MSVISPSIKDAPVELSTVREQFPILATTVDGKQLVYLDNGATTQKPRAVIDAISHYYSAENANIHRGVYHLSQLATERYEQARQKVRQFLNAADDREIIFTRGTTEGVNLVRAFVLRGVCRAGRSDSRFDDRAPRQHRAVATGSQAAGGVGPGDSGE